MSASIDTLTQTYSLASKLLAEFGLADEGWTFDFSKDKRTVGWCFRETKTIAYSLYFLHNDPAEIENTIRHEIAHALCPPYRDYNGRWVKHGAEWRAMAIRVGARPDRCAAPGVKASSKHNYEIRCSECHKVTSRRYRLRQAKLTNYISGCCSASLYAVDLREEE
jgi:predicted SprT family Zn-dependent metalloprotease